MIICGTGHRPQFCPCGFDNKHQWLKDLKNDLATALIVNNANKIIAGGAIGWDTWLAEVAVELNIPLHLYLPFRGQELRWPKESQEKYHELIDKAVEVRYIEPYYSSTAFHRRDRAMVDDSDKVFSLLNPEASTGGTYYTVQYAKRLDKQVINFWRD